MNISGQIHYFHSGLMFEVLIVLLIDMTKIKVKVNAGSSRNRIAGWRGETLKINIKEPPEKGRANKELIKFLAETLEIDRREIEISHGLVAPEKIITIHGLNNRKALAKIDKKESGGM